MATTLLVFTVLGGVVGAGLCLPEDASAQRRGRRGRQPAAPQTPQSAAIAPALGELAWGMSNREVYEHFRRQVEGRFAEQLAEARDAIREDAIRNEMNQEVQRIRRSYIRFNGQTTGWDVSFLRDEFTHNNNESMLVVRDGNSQNFYFFINDRLWKWYKAFDVSVFQGQDFDQFAAALQGRFGQALEQTGRMTNRGEEKHWLEWQDEATRLRAVDENQFYGFYCLVFEDRTVLDRLDELRTNQGPQRAGRHALVEAVTSDTSDASNTNQDIVDRITGRIRRRTNAPEESEEGSPSMTTSTSMRRTSMSTLEDDPLRGLDL